MESGSGKPSRGLGGRLAAVALTLLRFRSPRRRHSGCRSSFPGILPWALLVALPVTLWFLPNTSGGRTAAFWIFLAEILLALVVVGWLWRRSWRGVFTNSRNVVSLGAFQAVLWIAILGAAVATALLVASAAPAGAPVGLAIPEEAGLQGGIAVLTGAGAATAVAVKSKRQPAKEALNRAAPKLAGKDPRGYLENLASRATEAPAPWHDDLGASLAGVASTGTDHRAVVAAVAELQRATGDAAKTARILEQVLADPKADLDALVARVAPAAQVPAGLGERLQGLRRTLVDFVHLDLKEAGSVAYRNICPCEARWRDMLEGDEAADTADLDLAKLQFLAFTLLGFAVFIVGAVQGLSQGVAAAGPGRALSLGAYPAGMVELLGLSGAGYVGYKLPTRTRTTTEAAAEGLQAPPASAGNGAAGLPANGGSDVVNVVTGTRRPKLGGKGN